MKIAWASRFGMVTLVGALVLAGNPYMAHAGKPVPPPAPALPRVVDANNNVVGQVVGTSGYPQTQIFTPPPYNAVVALNISVPSIVVQVTTTHILGNAELLFTNSSCTGQPYFTVYDVNFPFKLFPLVGVGNGATLYAPQASSAPVSIATPYSLLFTGTCYSRGSSVDYSTAIIADPIIDLSTQFTPPYRFVYP